MTDFTPLPGTPGRSKKILLGRLLGTLLSFALFFYLIFSQGWSEFAEALSRLPALYFWLALFFVLLSRLTVALRWYVLLRSAELKMSLKDCTRLVFMGLFASNFLPSTVGGDLVRLAGALQQGLDAGSSAASLVTDRLVGMLGMASIFPVGLAAVLKSGGFTALQHERQVFGMLVIPGREWIREKVGRFGRSLRDGLVASTHKPAGLFWALVCTYGHMLFTFVAICLLLYGLDEPLSIWLVGGLWSLSYFVSLLPVSINGLGLQELSITYLYTHFGGVSMQACLALAVLLRVLFLLGSLPGAAFLPDILRPMRSQAATQQK
jgi:glycosyltransferase 2 family protein